MESLLFGAYCHRLGVRAASVSTTLLNRLNGDQVCFFFIYIYLSLYMLFILKVISLFFCYFIY